MGNLAEHRLNSLRLDGYDYSQSGAYFVTVVCKDRENRFGEIIDGVLELNDAGRVASTEWKKLANRFANIDLDEFVVMPNHIHGIIVVADPVGVGLQHPICGRADFVGARQDSYSRTVIPHFASPLPQTVLPQNPALGTIIGSYKSNVARIINGLQKTPRLSIWQRNYYEHIIRNEEEYDRIKEYILNNPSKWNEDTENLPKSSHIS
jgi:putative transposase